MTESGVNSRQAFKRVRQSGLTLHAGAVDVEPLPGPESDDAIFEKVTNFPDKSRNIKHTKVVQ